LIFQPFFFPKVVSQPLKERALPFVDLASCLARFPILDLYSLLYQASFNRINPRHRLWSLLHHWHCRETSQRFMRVKESENVYF
ncbi:unnamed protein product, partial [Arabidopsis halleri]